MNEDLFEKAEAVSEALSSIAHPLRLLIICILFKKERFVQELMDELGTTKGNISQHLRILTDRGLLAKRRDGNRIYYSIKDHRLHGLIGKVKSLYCPGLQL